MRAPCASMKCLAGWLFQACLVDSEMDLPCCKRASMATGWKDPILTIVLTEEPQTSRFGGVSSVLLVSVCLWDYGASKVRGSRCCCCRRPIRVASRWIDLSPLDADVIFGTPPQDTNMGRRLIRSRRVPLKQHWLLLPF